MRSLSEIGMPWSGPRSSPARSRARPRRLLERLLREQLMKALSARPASMRSRHARTSSTGEISPARICRATRRSFAAQSRLPRPASGAMASSASRLRRSASRSPAVARASVSSSGFSSASPRRASVSRRAATRRCGRRPSSIDHVRRVDPRATNAVHIRIRLFPSRVRTSASRGAMTGTVQNRCSTGSGEPVDGELHRSSTPTGPRPTPPPPSAKTRSPPPRLLRIRPAPPPKNA
jgi:hypothetical protein